jgi:SAM-dependent methyltransferase
MFAAPARDLAARMDFAGARSALDVGSGSGVVASMASECPFVVALDPSVEMLRTARGNGLPHAAAAVVPGLPFRDAAFDRVTASFVLSHVMEYEAALADMVRVLRPGGRLGATAWGLLTSEYRSCWDSLAERFVDPEELGAAMAQALPWEDLLGQPDKLRNAFAAAGLHDVQADLIEYAIHMNIETFLQIRENSLPARFLRRRLNEESWKRFRETVANEFHARFRDPVDHMRTAWIVVGLR